MPYLLTRPLSGRQSASNIITSPAEAALCLCRPGQAPRALLTSAAEMTLQLSVSAAAGRHVLRDNSTPLMTGTFQFVHGPFCGRPEATGDRLQYPALDYQPRQPTYCVWQVGDGSVIGVCLSISSEDTLLLVAAAICRSSKLARFTGKANLYVYIFSSEQHDFQEPVSIFSIGCP